MRCHRLILGEQLAALGRSGALGLILLVAAALYARFDVLPARQQLAGQRALLAAAPTRAEAGESAAPPPGPAQQLAEFYRALPPPSEAPAWIERIYAAAGREGLSLARGEYTRADEPQGRLVRYRISVPVRGRYPQIRRFVRAAQQVVPGLAVEEISLRRQSVAESEVDARIRMTLYLARP